MKYYLTGKQAQLIDKYTQEFLGIPGLLLMEKAAAKLADSIELLLTGTQILSVVESGNNGGDAVCAAWMLKERGYDTYIYEIGGISHKSDSYLAEIDGMKKIEAFLDDPASANLTDFEIISANKKIRDEINQTKNIDLTSLMKC